MLLLIHYILNGAPGAPIGTFGGDITKFGHEIRGGELNYFCRTPRYLTTSRRGGNLHAHRGDTLIPGESRSSFTGVKIPTSKTTAPNVRAWEFPVARWRCSARRGGFLSGRAQSLETSSPSGVAGGAALTVGIRFIGGCVFILSLVRVRH